MIDGDMVWTGETLQQRPELYRIDLTEDHIRELEKAAEMIQGIH